MTIDKTRTTLMPAVDERSLAIISPAFNEWDAIPELLSRVDDALVQTSRDVLFVIINDGSTDLPPDDLSGWLGQSVREVRILNLRRNLGHQRAIAIGLAYLENSEPDRSVIVMDSDGEDRPEDIPKLLSRGRERPRRIVFAERAKRFEPLWFRCFYLIFRILHLILTGIPVKVGNFSYIPTEIMPTVVVVSGLWSHYAAGVFEARIPRTGVAISRGSRISGSSKMNLFSLVNHGMSAISVFAERVGVRLLLFSLISFVFIAVVIALILWGGLFVSLRYEVIFILTIAAASVFHVATSVLIFLMLVLNTRDRYSFIPIRDFQHFIRDVTVVSRSC